MGADREEYGLNKRIVDHAIAAGVWVFSFEPDESGTTRTGAFGWPGSVPFVDELMDQVCWNGDRDLEIMLTNLKAAFES